MYLGLSLFGVVAVMWTISAFSTSPRAAARARAADRSRGAERRVAHRSVQLRVCPDRATILDVEQLLRAHPLPDHTVARVLGTAAERRISSRTMWCWADRFGADKLVLAVDADVAEKRLQRHLDAGTTPDWLAMAVFADLNEQTLPGAMPVDEILDLDAVPAADPDLDLTGWETEAAGLVATDVDLSQFAHLPPIFDPGLPVARSMTPPAPGDGDGDGQPRNGDWPQVA